jgi:peptidyl-prolyl cis-trans isomerase B (cyclophilin B)
MGLSETQKNPAIKGRGLAMAGLIIGYVMLVLQVVAVFVFIALSYKVKETFNTINAQLKDAEQTNSAPANSTTPDSSTNSATTNAAPATQ